MPALDVVLPINRGFCPWNLVMVGSLLLTLPMLLIYFFGQHFMDQLSLSGGSAGIK
jgi:multiple sugar transport system permease protein